MNDQLLEEIRGNIEALSSRIDDIEERPTDRPVVMPAFGGGGSSSSADFSKITTETFAGNSSQTVFSVANPVNVSLFVSNSNGTVHTYSRAGQVYTLDVAPNTGETVTILYIKN
jgi:hypothetical protein